MSTLPETKANKELVVASFERWQAGTGVHSICSAAWLATD